MTNRTFFLALSLIFVIGVAVAFSGPSLSQWRLVGQYVAVIALTGAFGGFVHGLLARSRVKYNVVLPHRGQQPEERDIGIWGDVFIGAAAGTALFWVLDTLFGITVKAAENDAQVTLKMVGLGVLSGYLGMVVLENLSVMFNKKLTTAQIEADKTVEEAQQLQARIKAASRARQLTPLGDAYRRWFMWDAAINLYDEAIRIEPANAENYLQKSFVYADQGEAALKELKKEGVESEKGRAAQETVNRMYDNAILWAEKAVEADKTSARAYYDRACYKHVRKAVDDKVVFADLATAFSKADGDVMRKMAKADPDFKDLLTNPSFQELLDKEVGAPPSAGAAATVPSDIKAPELAHA
jgi:hypothetical protein